MSFQDLPEAGKPYTEDPLPKFEYTSPELEELLVKNPVLLGSVQSDLQTSELLPSSSTETFNLSFIGRRKKTDSSIPGPANSAVSLVATARPATPALVSSQLDTQGLCQKPYESCSLDKDVKFESLPPEGPFSEVEQRQEQFPARSRWQVCREWFRFQTRVQRILYKR